jgi:hypothetical protein
MTLEEYEKVREEKRKALQAPKTEERKVDTKEFESMQQLSNKKENNDIFIKLVKSVYPLRKLFEFLFIYVLGYSILIIFCHLMFLSFQGSEKDKRREALEKEEKAKKVIMLAYLFSLLHFIVLSV